MRRRFSKLRPIATKCSFCEEKGKPDYKNPESLIKFLSERGRILSRARTGVCAKHQRRLTSAIKRARHLALLPFLTGRQ